MGICYRASGSGGRCEGEQLQEVVGGADHGPFGTHFLDAPQQELAEAACLFDLSEHRFHHLLSQSVGCFEAAVVDLLSHPLGQRSADFSVRCGRVLGASKANAAKLLTWRRNLVAAPIVNRNMRHGANRKNTEAILSSSRSAFCRLQLK